MISRLHFSLTLVCIYTTFFYFLNFSKLGSIILSIFTAFLSSIPDWDWRIYSWSNKKLVFFNKHTTLKILLFPFYISLYVINKTFRHRTTTHSLLFALIFLIFAKKFTFFIVFFLAVLCHIIEDMFTVSGVPLFYPLSKKSYKIPILNTRKHRHIQIVLSYLLLLLYVFLLIF